MVQVQLLLLHVSDSLYRRDQNVCSQIPKCFGAPRFTFQDILRMNFSHTFIYV